MMARNSFDLRVLQDFQLTSIYFSYTSFCCLYILIMPAFCYLYILIIPAFCDFPQVFKVDGVTSWLSTKSSSADGNNERCMFQFFVILYMTSNASFFYQPFLVILIYDQVKTLFRVYRIGRKYHAINLA